MPQTITKPRRRRRRRHLLSAVATLLLLLVLCAVLLFSFFPLGYADEVAAACEQYNLPPSLVYALIRVESNFDPNAESPAGALGVMQITPETYAWSCLRKACAPCESNALLDPKTNIDTGTHILSLLYEQFDSTDTVLAAYNAGIGNVTAWLSDPRYSKDGKTLHDIPFDETAHYVKKIRHARFAYKLLYHLD